MARVVIFPGASGHAEVALSAAAGRISKCLVSRGHVVEIVGELRLLDEDLASKTHGVVIGARLSAGALPVQIRDFLVSHQAWLARTTTALYYITPGPDRDETGREESSRGRSWDPRDEEALGPLLRYQSYGLFKRFAVFGGGGDATSGDRVDGDEANARRTGEAAAQGDEELSDWREVEALADRFADHLEAGMTVG